MARPPRLAITVGMAVAMAVDSMAPRKSPSITPKTISPRRGGTGARHDLAARPAVVHWAHGHCPRRSTYGSNESCPSCHTTRKAPVSRRISIGHASVSGAQAPHGQAARSRAERIDAPVPVLPRHAERVAPDERDGTRAIRVGADQRAAESAARREPAQAPRAAAAGLVT